MNLSSINQNLLSRIFSRGINTAAPTKNQFSAKLLEVKNSTKPFSKIPIYGSQNHNNPTYFHTKTNQPIGVGAIGKSAGKLVFSKITSFNSDYSKAVIGRSAGRLFLAKTHDSKNNFSSTQLNSTYSTNTTGNKLSQLFTADKPLLKHSTMNYDELIVSDLIKSTTRHVSFDLNKTEYFE